MISIASTKPKTAQKYQYYVRGNPPFLSGVEAQVGDIWISEGGRFYKIILIDKTGAPLTQEVNEPDDLHAYKRINPSSFDAQVYRKMNGLDRAIDKWVDSDVD